MTVHFIIPGNLNSLTGGYLYNMQIITGLRQRGHMVETPGTSWSWKDTDLFETSCRACFKGLPKGATVIIDSLALASLQRVIQEFAGKLIFIGLIHLPVSYDIRSGVHGTLAEDELKSFHQMDLVIVTGKFTAELLGNAGLDNKKIRLAEPGTEHFPRKKAYRPVPSNLICIANYSAVKAQDILVRALAGLRDRDWTAHLYGDTDHDKEYTAVLTSLIRDLKLEQRIRMHGIVERNQVSTVLLDADLFVMPSLFESYGMAITEALAHGIPVVSTSAGNIPYTIPDGMGVLTEPSNEESLSTALRMLFDDPVQYSGLCSAAAQYYLHARSWDEAADEFEKIIGEV
jgi:glycosyltransferase involved in cell wall biosynthesis